MSSLAPHSPKALVSMPAIEPNNKKDIKNTSANTYECVYYLHSMEMIFPHRQQNIDCMKGDSMMHLTFEKCRKENKKGVKISVRQGPNHLSSARARVSLYTCYTKTGN